MSEFILALIYYFKESLGNFNIKGFFLSDNLDLFYAFAIFILLYYLIKRKKFFNGALYYYYFIPIIIYSIIQLVFIKDINVVKLIINVIKISICIFLFLYTKENFNKINIKKFIDYICMLFIISIPISLSLKKSFLWRNADYINIYSLRRLMLFYLEPSELGFQVAIVLIFLISFFLNSNNKMEKLKYFVYIISCLILLYLSKPLGAILLVSFSAFIMITIYLYKNTKLIDFTKVYSALIIILIAIIALLIKSKNQIYLRIINTLNSKDPSNIYRINISYDVMKEALIKTYGLGIGFGNLNTQKSQLMFRAYGLVKVVANSFMYFIIEGGVFSIVYIITLLVKLTKRVLKDKSILKYGLFIFVSLYQIFAGHFTNPMNWIIYGIIFSNLKINVSELNYSDKLIRKEVK